VKSHIAYLFRGHLREYQRNSGLKPNLLDLNPGDLFVHTWSTRNALSPMWHRNTIGSTTPTTTHDIAELKKFGPIIDAMIDEQPKDWHPLRGGNESYRRVFRMYENYVKETNTHYDVVCNIRFDLDILEPFEFPPVEQNTFHTARNLNAERNGQVADTLYWTTPEVAKMLEDNSLARSITDAAGSGDFGFVGEAATTERVRRLGLNVKTHRMAIVFLRPGGNDFALESG
jgi:hypothetical protein